MQNIITNTFSLTAVQNGTDAFVFDLDNEMDAVPVDANGKVTYATTILTRARIRKGADFIREGLTLPTQASLAIPYKDSNGTNQQLLPTITNSGGIVSISWAFTTAMTLTAARYDKTVQMTYDGHTYSGAFSLLTDKSGCILQLLPSMDDIPFTRDNSNALIPASRKVYCGYTKNQNGTITTFDGTGDNQHTAIEGKYYIYYRTVQTTDNYGSWTAMTKAGITVANSDTNSAYQFCLSSKSAANQVADSNIIDKETIPIVREGKHAAFLDLDNECDAVQTDSTGKVSAARDIITHARLYDGPNVKASPTLPTAASLAISYKAADGTTKSLTPTITNTNNSGVIEIKWSFTTAMTLTSDVTEKTITIDGKSAVFTLLATKGAPIFQLQPTLDIISFSRTSATDNTLTPASRTLGMSVLKIDGASTASTSVADSGKIVRYSTSSMPSSKTAGSAWPTDGLTVNNSDTYKNIYIAMFDSNGILLDRETVPVLCDGINGKNAVILSLDNEHEDFIYDDAGNRKSAHVKSQARLYDGGTEKTSGITWSIESASGSTLKNSGAAVTSEADDAYSGNSCWITKTGVLHVNGITANTAVIKVKAVYNELPYYAEFTANKTNQDKYDLVLLPNSIAYNPASYTAQTINISAKRTDIQGNQTSATISTTSASGQLRLFRSWVNANGTMTTAAQLTTLSQEVSAANAESYAGVYFELRKYADASGNNSSSYSIADYQTVQITKAQNGTSPYFADLDNEMDSVVCNAAGATTSEQYVETNISMFKGNTKQTIKSSGGIVCKISSYELGDSYAAEGTPSPTANYKAVVTGLGTTSAKVKIYVKSGTSISSPVRVTITVKSTIDGEDRTCDLTLTINGVRPGPDGTPATVYNLMPSVSEVNVGRTDAGGYTPQYNTLKCGYKKVIGSSPTTVEDASGTIDSKYRIFFRRRTRSTGAWDSYYYHYAHATYKRYLVETSGYDTSGLNAATYDKVEFVLYKDTSSSTLTTLTEANIIDRETVPVVCDGQKGGEGPEGNGITGVTYYRMLTQNFQAEADDSGWIVETNGNYPQIKDLVKPYNYLWQKKVTTYKKTSATTEISLLAQRDSGICENLLEDTAFLSEGQMEAWTAKNGSIGQKTVGEHNSFGNTPDYSTDYRELLQQRVYRKNVLHKLKEDTWYTLSFVAAQADYTELVSSTTYNGQSDSNYGYVNGANKQFFVGKGNTVKMTFKGYNASSSVRMTCNLFCRYASSNGWEISTSAQITSTGTQTVTLTLTNTTGRDALFECEVVVYNTSTGNVNTSDSSSYRGYITKVTLDRGARMGTFLYRSDGGQAVVHSASAPWYVDGKKVTAATTLDDGESGNALRKGTYVRFGDDGGVYWQLNPGHVKHSVTFKTPSSFASGVDYLVLFRLTEDSNYGWVSMPKLEENTIATEWIEHTNDRMADEIQHVYVGEWSSGTTYYYGGGTGVRHVVRAKKSATGAKTYFRMKVRTTSSGYVSTTEPYNDSTHWEQADHLNFVAADLLLADEAIINFTQANRILVKNASGGIAAGMGGAAGGDTDYPLWVGATYENRANAPFRVNLQGKLFATGAEIVGKITGSLRAPFYRTDQNPTLYFKDNIVLANSSSGSVVFVSGEQHMIMGGEATAQSGRLIRLIAGKWGSQEGHGTATIKFYNGDKSVQYKIWEDGIEKTSIDMSNEVVELIGYGSETEFFGWIVLNRKDFMTQQKFGAMQTFMMVGKITGSSSGVNKEFLRAFDGSTITATRTSEGLYKISVPTSWKIAKASLLVIANPIGYIANGSNMILGCSIESIEESGGYVSAFSLQISDDQTRNDGSINFAVINMDFWH